MNLKRVLFFTAMIAFTASSVYGTFYPIVGDNEQTLTYDATGKLDLTNNSGIIQVSPNYAGVFSAIATGYNGGTWTGKEITSSVCANPANGGIYALAPMSVTDYKATYSTIPNPDPSFYGPTAYPGSLGVDHVSTLPSTATLIKFTYLGDANLDGYVNTTDFNLLNASLIYQNVNGPGTVADTWVNGDFNYDTFINTTDFNLLNAQLIYQNVNGPYQAMPLSAGGITPVPEPTTIVLVLLGLVSLVAFKKLRK